MILLGYALEDARGRGVRGPATLNVIAPHRRPSAEAEAAGWRDPVPYYRRLGYRIVPGAVGRLADGSGGYPEDTWMSGPIPVVLRRVHRLLVGRRAARA